MIVVHVLVILFHIHWCYYRLTVTAGIVPSISVSNILNETNINKVKHFEIILNSRMGCSLLYHFISVLVALQNFKDMNASTAFGFVFDAGVIQKHVNATSLAQETQVSFFRCKVLFSEFKTMKICISFKPLIFFIFLIYCFLNRRLVIFWAIWLMWWRRYNLQE